GGELDDSDPLGALPEVATRNDEPERPAVLGRERGAVVRVGEKDVIVFELRARQVRREPLLGANDREPCFGPRRRTAQHLPKRHALPQIVVAAPARDAMDVATDLHARASSAFDPTTT